MCCFMTCVDFYISHLLLSVFAVSSFPRDAVFSCQRTLLVGRCEMGFSLAAVLFAVLSIARRLLRV